MIKKVALIAFLFFVVGCATTPNLKQLNSLQPGITKTELIERFGEPVSAEYVDGCYILYYSMSAPNTLGVTQGYHFFFDDYDKLASWKYIKTEGKGNSKTGVIVHLPLLPSR